MLELFALWVLSTLQLLGDALLVPIRRTGQAQRQSTTGASADEEGPTLRPVFWPLAHPAHSVLHSFPIRLGSSHHQLPCFPGLWPLCHTPPALASEEIATTIVRYPLADLLLHYPP